MEYRQAGWARLSNPLVARAYHTLRYRRLPEFPPSLLLETTSRCNLDCHICPRRTMTRPARDMSPAFFSNLVAQIAEFDRRNAVELVALHWFGEPLIHPQFIDFVYEAGNALPNLRQRGLLRNAVRGLNMSTNATLLTEELAKDLLDSPLTWLAVSVDGASSKTYETMRGPNVFARVVKNVANLLTLNRTRSLELPTIAFKSS